MLPLKTFSKAACFCFMKLFYIQRYCSSLATLNLNLRAKESQILNHCKSGALFNAFRLFNSIDWTKLSNKPFFFASLLQTCVKVVSFDHGLQIHGHVIKSGLESDRFVGNSLLALYFKLGPNFFEARRVFDGLYFKDVISWTSMITGYIKLQKPSLSLELFWEMLELGIEPNGFTLSAVIKACSDLGELKLGKCFHGVVVVRGFDSNIVIICALIDMYGSNHEPDDARILFEELPDPDAVCWTSVISAFIRNDMYDKGLGFFYLMQREHGLLPDEYTFGTVLTACGNLGRLKQGRELHAKVITSGLNGKVVVESSLVDMYAKCGMVDDSQRLFERMVTKNSVSRCALLGGYCHNGDFKSVLRIFREMEDADLYSFGTIIRACAGLGAVQQGKEVHCQYVRRGSWRDVVTESALVDLYAKCGCIDFAHRIFQQMAVRNMISWNAMIRGFAQNGRGDEAVRIFDEMIKQGNKPDRLSFLGVLFACSHAGLVDKGREYFASMTQTFGIKPVIEHFNCVVDLLGRAALLDEAESLIQNSEYRDNSSLWVVLLGACATYTNSATAERIAKKTMQLKPDYHLSYIYLSNIYRTVGRWDDAAKILGLMKDRRVKKMPGMSWT